jgi:phosphopantothenoylcysteine decarboxylase/phosphopantothenate--cysteine ligase
MARILLGVSGGIAAYKALELVRLATGTGHSVRVVQTPASLRFVGRASFAALSGAPALVSEFERDAARGSFPGEPLPAHDPASHLELAARADVYLIAPASANTIAKLAAGLADNLLCSCALAAESPVLVAPAMNSRMYEHAAVQANLRALRERGITVVEPGSGRLATIGEHGIGRLAEPEQLLAECERALGRRGVRASSPRTDLAGLRVLVTAGGTREPIDSVRFIGNSSSGRMGVALAQAAQLRGAQVTLVAANLALPVPAGIECRRVGTAAELQRVCEHEFDTCDVLLMAAAVADFRPLSPAHGKLSKSGRDALVLELDPTPDVLAGLARRRRPGQIVVGFAAEHGDEALAAARRKLYAKGLDAIVVNDISRSDIGFDSDHNEVAILTARRLAQTRRPDEGGGEEPQPQQGEPLTVARASKPAVAEHILDVVERLRQAPAPATPAAPAAPAP